MHYNELNKELGNIDLYLLDQILKGRFDSRNKILDAGCGEGRNLHYFVKNGFKVFGTDSNPMAIQMAKAVYKNVPKENWELGMIQEMQWADSSFDGVICNAVLHFAKNQSDFFRMFEEMCRVLSPNGLMFIRTATVFGLDSSLPDKNGFNYRMTIEDLQKMQNQYGLTLAEPVKSIWVNGERSMAALVFIKG